MAIKEGEKLPEANLFVLSEGRPTQLSVNDLTAGKKTVIFAVPGAFTPTCSEQHLPGYVRNLSELKAKGVDEVVCVSVNDPFVMDAWGKDRNAEGIVMASDGNGEFAESLGLVMDGSGFGLGKRSQRYAMIVDDGVVSKLAVESAGGFDVSKAESILEAL
ncbi:MAG: peroxiredoxin [Gammaproteobacteria bacterium]|nr:peroxiredoxin [Gammaproteobacteria bacterium]